MPDNNVPAPVKPLRPFRILRNNPDGPAAVNYKTRQARDAGARRWADHDGQPVCTELWDASHLQDACNRGWAMDGLVAPLRATVTLHIENHYELYSMVETTATVTLPVPPADDSSDAYDDWRETYIQPETGTGRTDGDSWYFVRITASTVPALLDRAFEFGV